MEGYGSESNPNSRDVRPKIESALGPKATAGLVSAIITPDYIEFSFNNL